ncbi:hypothetical protein VTI28DRAFT_2489 [Corynascus sepedonium]
MLLWLPSSSSPGRRAKQILAPPPVLRPRRCRSGFVAGKSGLAPTGVPNPDPVEPYCVDPLLPEPRLPIRRSFSLIPPGSYAVPSSKVFFVPFASPTRPSSHWLFPSRSLTNSFTPLTYQPLVYNIPRAGSLPR